MQCNVAVMWHIPPPNGSPSFEVYFFFIKLRRFLLSAKDPEYNCLESNILLYIRYVTPDSALTCFITDDGVHYGRNKYKGTKGTWIYIAP